MADSQSTALNPSGQAPEAFLEPGASPPAGKPPAMPSPRPANSPPYRKKPGKSAPRRKPAKQARQAPVFVNDCTLEKFVRPIAHMTAILSDLTCINPDQRGTGTEEAITWLAVQLNARAEELRAVLDREPPRWFTDMEADARREALQEYCGRSIPDTPAPSPEWLAALAAMEKARG